MIERSFDEKRVNYLVNHEAIRPTCGGDVNEYLDLTEAVKNTDNIFLLDEHGGLAFVWSAPRVYEVHVFILPDGRGKWGFDFALAARDYMEDHAVMLWARINAVPLKLFTMKAGFTPAGEQVLDIGSGPVSYQLYKWEY